MPSGGIRTHDLCRRAAADLRLRPRGHRDRHTRRYKEVKNYTVCVTAFKNLEGIVKVTDNKNVRYSGSDICSLILLFSQ